MRSKSILILAAVLFVFIPWTSQSVFAGQIVIWGGIEEPNDSNLPPDPNLPWHSDNKDYVGISIYSNHHFLALKSDGTIIDWVFDGCPSDLCEYPDTNDFIKVAAGNAHSMALRTDGSLIAWGSNSHGQRDVPAGEFVNVATGGPKGLAIKADGSLIEWGYIYDSNTYMPSGNNFVGISVGLGSCYALDSNGSISAWGNNIYGQCDVPEGNDFTKISAGGFFGFCLAVRDNGSLIGWGNNNYGQCDVPAGNDYVDVAAGNHHGLAIRTNGTLAAWGENIYGQCDVPDGNDFVTIAASDKYSMALTSDNFKILTMTTDPPSLDCVSPSLGETEYYNGQTIFVNAPRCPDCPNVYEFDYWEGDVADANSSLTFLTMDSDKSIKAFYSADQRVCGDECHPILQGDINEDCYINFEDFAIYVQLWMSCTHPDCD